MPAPPRCTVCNRFLPRRRTRQTAYNEAEDAELAGDRDQFLRCLFWNLKATKKATKKPKSGEADSEGENGEDAEEADGPRVILEPRKGNLLNALARFAGQYQVDLFLLAECPIVPEVIARLNKEIGRKDDEFSEVIEAGIPQKKVVVVARGAATRSRLRLVKVSEFPDEHTTIFDEDAFNHPRLTLLRVLDQEQKTLLVVAGVHLLDRGSSSSTTRREEARRIARRIRYAERFVFQHSRTLVVGDFNMDPFEEGMVLADCFHATPYRNQAGTDGNLVGPLVGPTGKTEPIRVRGVQGGAYPLFYNPAWKFLGDGETAPGGTYYYSGGGGHIPSGWHVLDQVLVRPTALPLFDESALRVVTVLEKGDDGSPWSEQLSLVKHLPEAGKKMSLRQTSGVWKPDKERYSDHLPVFFQIRLSGSPAMGHRTNKRKAS